MTPWKGSELLLAKEIHPTDHGPERGDCLKVTQQGILELLGGGDHCPKSQNLRISEMAVTGSNSPHNSCIPKTMSLSVQASVYTLN